MVGEGGVQAMMMEPNDFFDFYGISRSKLTLLGKGGWDLNSAMSVQCRSDAEMRSYASNIPHGQNMARTSPPQDDQRPSRAATKEKNATGR